MNRTAIEWVINPDGSQGFTWNPATGCRHNCSYCYAARIAKRFPATFPKGFGPDFHPERLSEPLRRKKPATIFVCSMADLFGAWVPSEWIEKVLQTVWDAPQHQFIFLTKNPKRYTEFIGLRNALNGATADGQAGWDEAMKYPNHVDFISAEPLLEAINPHGIERLKWLVIGANSNRGAEKPRMKWGGDLIESARKYSVPVFVKNNWPWLRHSTAWSADEWPPQEFPEVANG